MKFTNFLKLILLLYSAIFADSLGEALVAFVGIIADCELITNFNERSLNPFVEVL